MVEKKVAILMCTFNGEQFLSDQLHSIVMQTHQNWVLWVSDDGSTDKTLKILKSTQEQLGESRIKILSGPRRGFARNFLALACHNDIIADYYAFSDQDDFWLPEKLSRAIKMLSNYPKNSLTLYGSRTRLIDARGKVLGNSTLKPRCISYHNALVQNIFGGNTMVFNQAMRNELLAAGADLDIVSHDWWLYILATALNVIILFDLNPSIHYRQHKGNIAGANSGITAVVKRLKQILSGRWSLWIKQNQICLSKMEAQLPEHVLKTSYALATLNHYPLIDRVVRFKKLGVKRQSRLGTSALFIAVIFNRI